MYKPCENTKKCGCQQLYKTLLFHIIHIAWITACTTAGDLQNNVFTIAKFFYIYFALQIYLNTFATCDL